MEQDAILTSLVLELRRGTIVLCVLSQLQQPMYGYHLIGVLGEKGIPIEANTLYPLLRRLEGQGLLESHWETSGAKPRKYYGITPGGQQVYQALRAHWLQTVDSMNTLLGGNEHDSK